MRQWTWECRYLFKVVISFPLDIYPEVRLLYHMVALYIYIYLKNFHPVFHSDFTNLHLPPTMHKSSLFSISIPTLLPLAFLIIAVLIGVQFFLTCISLIISDSENFPYICWPFACLFWKNIYSRPLSVLIGLFVLLLLSCMSFLWFFMGIYIYICSIIQPWERRKSCHLQ